MDCFSVTMAGLALLLGALAAQFGKAEDYDAEAGISRNPEEEEEREDEGEGSLRIPAPPSPRRRPFPA